ncbi:Tautomerase/MIF [Russula earlei]|uniref:Tautomerase/MIF n=1 Tax=Russula earlei TaxID=71964 RepID=A0ACC0UI68_9AGAM|nr:Tautomerase/MIF [Russula earlei]
MPTVFLETNVKISNPQSFVLKLSKAAANILGVPEGFVMVSYRYNEYFAFAGTFEPAFSLALIAAGVITPEKNDVYCKELFAFFDRELGVGGDRGYIQFNDADRANLGFQGMTVAKLLG